MEVIWRESSDVLLISKRDAVSNSCISFASPSMVKQLGPALAADWLRGKVHELRRSEDECEELDEVDPLSRSLIELISRGFHVENKGSQSFAVELNLDSDDVKRTVEVNVNTSFDGETLVTVMRDITDRTRLHEAEKLLVANEVARAKDEEVNHFTRHEVKNGLISAQALVTQVHDLLPDEGLRRTLNTANNVLHTTLSVVLSDAMAREVVHGIYKPQIEGVRLCEVLQLEPDQPNSRFAYVEHNGPLPRLLLDPRLLHHIHRNAISNAIKYGKAAGRVTTEVTHNGRDVLTVVVRNEPGDGHEHLLALKNASVVFEKGVQLAVPGFSDPSSPNPSSPTRQSRRMRRSSAGDGGWIIKRCE